MAFVLDPATDASERIRVISGSGNLKESYVEGTFDGTGGVTIDMGLSYVLFASFQPHDAEDDAAVQIYRNASGTSEDGSALGSIHSNGHAAGKYAFRAVGW